MEDYLCCDFPVDCHFMPRDWYRLTIGRSAGEDVIIMDEHISSKHAVVELSGDKNMLIISVLGRNGAEINGIYYKSGSKVIKPVGARLQICSLWMCIGRFHSFIGYRCENDSEKMSSAPYRTGLIRLDTFPVLQDAGNVATNFAPTVRRAPTYNLEPIELDSPPARKNPEKQPILLVAGPALTMAVPILLGSGRKIMLIAGVISAVWASANVLSRRKKVKNEEKRRRRSYAAYALECENHIKERVKEIKNAMISAYPGIEDYLKGGGNIHLVWNRSIDQEDYWFLRCGIGAKGFPVEIKYQREKFTVTEDSLKYLPGELKRKYSVMKGVPIGVNLDEKRIFGISTEEVKKSWEVAFSLTLMLAVSMKCEDIKIAYLPINPSGLLSVAFLPHNWQEGNSLLAVPGMDEEVLSRIKASTGTVCLFTDRLDIVSEMLPYNNIKIFYIAQSFEYIPPYVDCIMHVSKSFSGIIDCSGVMQDRTELIFDQLSLEKFDEYSRIISSLSSHVCDIRTPIPDKVLLLDLLERTIIHGEINEDLVKECWRERNQDDSLSVPLGMTFDDRIVWLDIDEKSSGPHGLISGTTGSGKSELLQTFILSLTVRFSPEDVTFFLIDYKGGGMANMFSNLPHLAGAISNLSGAAIERAMVSIKSEIRFRQMKFNEMGVNCIRDYRRAAKMPHILIIIDEFAELKKEEPEFMAQLISVAQVGRSLGVHLILSTQKPSGVVDDKIWSNARFRICLKVRDKMDSMDMLHRPDAAYITNVGRAYIQVGNDEIFEEFQCGYTSAPVSKKCIDSGIRLYNSQMTRMQLPHLEEQEDTARTQIDFIQEIIRKAYISGNFGIVRKLWLDELSPYILPRAENKLGLGIYDDPANQYQGEYSFDLEKSGNMAIIGTSGCGKSVFLMRLIYGLICTYDPSKLNMYILDFGGKRLDIFGKCNHCGGYISIEESDRILKLLRFIGEEIKSRQQQKGQEVPNILVIIDNYAGMIEYSGTELSQEIIDMLRSGRSQKVTFAISSGGIGNGELPGRALALMDTVIPLSMKDKYSYSAALNVPASIIPAIDMLPGRGMVRIDKRILAFQSYVPVESNNENQWEDTIAKVIERQNKRFNIKAAEYPYIPPNPTVKKLSTFLESASDSSLGIPMGYVQETGKIYYLPYRRISVLLLSGRLRSGRKNALSCICHMALTQNISVFHINHIKELSELINQKNNGIVAVNDLGMMIGEFYKDNYDQKVEETVLEYLDKVNMYPEESELKIFGVIGPKGRASLMGRKLWTSICEHPFGICMGGSLDEQNMFDYSYMGYAAMSKRRRAGWGSVAFYEEDIYFGHIIVPLCEK